MSEIRPESLFHNSPSVDNVSYLTISEADQREESRRLHRRSELTASLIDMSESELTEALTAWQSTKGTGTQL